MKSLINKWNLLRDDIILKTGAIPDELLFKSPQGLSNNILWQLGHIARTSEFLTLKFAGVPMSFPVELDPYFAKGSSPASWNPGSIKPSELFTLEKKSREYLSYILKEIDPDKPFAEPYTTSLGVVLACVRDSFEYNLYHEGIHAGQIVIYKKLLHIS